MHYPKEPYTCRAVWFTILTVFCISIASLVTFLSLNNIGVTPLNNNKNIHLIAKDLRLVCYYDTPNLNGSSNSLKLSQVDANLCTHINIGFTSIQNFTIVLLDNIRNVLTNELPILRKQNPELKILLWIGGEGPGNGFIQMVAKHDTRKIFIKSIKDVLNTYNLDGVDLDWEFPSAYNKERIHFSQLLYEIREEFKREKRADYLLSIAVAAVEGIALFAYDIREINLYVDYVNLMSYDYHFYAKDTPFTGINAPLYARDNERSILATLNINYSVNWWLSNGLDRHKLVIGLPTYGHSFTLVNPFNNGIEAPAENYGLVGEKGFTTYSEICWFLTHNVGIKYSFDAKAASPYLSSGMEWISYENETSIAIKSAFVRSLNVGGIMAFSLNADDTSGYCVTQNIVQSINTVTFPLIKIMKKQLHN